MKLIAVPAFTDNYIWMVHDAQRAVVVDPGDAAPVLDTLERLGLDLHGILVTHHHGDHVGGLAALRPWLAEGAEVWGPGTEGIEGLDRTVREGERLDCLGAPLEVLEVPGHTRGHLAYLLHPPGQESPWLFCGDTLFSAGCGRLFEGTPAQLHGSLAKLAALPGATRVCCAHEYTLANLAFAAAVEPGNAAIAAHRATCEALRARGEPTLPSRLALEQSINPFLRTHLPEVAAQARLQGAPSADPVEVLAALRRWKNTFR